MRHDLANFSLSFEHDFKKAINDHVYLSKNMKCLICTVPKYLKSLENSAEVKKV